MKRNRLPGWPAAALMVSAALPAASAQNADRNTLAPSLGGIINKCAGITCNDR